MVQHTTRQQIAAAMASTSINVHRKSRWVLILPIHPNHQEVNMALKIEGESHELRDFFIALDQAAAERGALSERCENLQIEVSRYKAAQTSTAVAPPPHLEENVKLLIRAVSSNQKIAAIKAVRAMLGLGLKEAKDFVEAQWGHSPAW